MENSKKSKNFKGILMISLAFNLVLFLAAGYLLSTKSIMSDEPFPPGDCDTICMSYTGAPSANYIDGLLALSMARNYQASRPVIDNGVYSGVDAGSVWFGLEDLKKFIWKIESTLCERSCPDPISMGIRIYYARYPKLDAEGRSSFSDLADVNEEYGLMHTVFMVPTFDLPSNPDAHYDFNLNSAFECYPERMTEQSHGKVADFVVLGAKAKNHGTLCPPVCEGAAFGH